MERNVIIPLTYHSFPSFGKIGIIGGTGKVGVAFISSLKETNLDIVLFAHNNQAFLRLILLKDDLFINSNFLITKEIEALSNCDLIIFLAGNNTSILSGLNLKDRLLEQNKSLIQNYIKIIPVKHWLIVTNPCTRLTQLLSKAHLDRVFFSVGVYNDQLRFDYGKNIKTSFVVGAHNFSELIIGTSESGSTKPCFFKNDDYAEFCSKQDTFLEEGNSLSQLTLLDSLDKDNKWYFSQRLKSKMLQSQFSIAKALSSVLDYFNDLNRDLIVTLETVYFIEQFDIHSCIGWPIKSNRCIPLHFTDEQVSILRKIVEKYRH